MSGFLNLAKTFSNVLKAHTSRGIALSLNTMKTVYDTVHKPTIDILLPASNFPISYREYMLGIMQATNEEVVDFLTYLKGRNMYVVDPVLLNRPEGSFARIPPDPILREYDIVRFDASVHRSPNVIHQNCPTKLHIGLGAVCLDNEHKLLWDCRWEAVDFKVGRLTGSFWNKLIAMQEVNALRNVLEGKFLSGSSMHNMTPCNPGPFVNFIGDSEKVVNCFRGTCPIPDELYPVVAASFLKLTEYGGFVFSHEHRERNGIADFLAHLGMRSARKDVMLMPDEHLKFQHVVSDYYTPKTSFRFKC